MSRYPDAVRAALRRRALDENIVPPSGVYQYPAMRVAPYYEQYGTQFVWDLPYSGYAVARVGAGPGAVKGFLRNHVAFALTDGPDAGMLPRHVNTDGTMAGQDGSQCSLLAWLAREVHRLEPDAGFVADVYPALAAFADWWQSPRRDVDRDGLSEYAGSTPTYVSYESGHDYSPERDLVMGQPTEPGPDGLVHEPIADVFLNSCLHVELDALADLAEVVDPGRAGEWRERRDRLAARMHEAMWDEEVGGFFPVVRADLCAAQPRYYRHTAALVQPLWAGIATEQQAARTIALLRQHGRDYPWYDGTMRVRVDPALYHGYQVVTDALHPTRGTGPAAGGVELTGDGFVLRFAEDRGPATAAFTRISVDVTVADVAADARVAVRIVDGRQREQCVIDEKPDAAGSFSAVVGRDPMGAIDQPDWVPGLREIRVEAQGCRVPELRVRYARMDRAGLLSAYGVKSAHPLDGKHPAPGAPTEFWSGTVWGPHQLHAVQALRRYGETDLADAISRCYADTVVTAFGSGGDVFEHNSHEDGRGLGVGRYTWGAAVALVLMEDLHE